MNSRNTNTISRPGASIKNSTNPEKIILPRKHRPDYFLIMFMGLLMLIGLMVMYAIGPQRANFLNNIYDTDYTDSYFFVKQGTSVLLALVAFFVASLTPLKWIQKNSKYILMAGIFACIALSVAALLKLGIAQCSYGACRWFNFGPIGFQPAELLKLGFLLFVSMFFGLRVKQGLIEDAERTLIPIGIVLAVALALIVGAQKDLGTGMVLIAISGSMAVVSGMSTKLLRNLVIATIVGVIIMAVTAPHRVERLMTFFKGDSTSVSDNNGYHITHAKIAIGTGGLFGVGVGNSVQATGYLPEVINDSVFAVMGETFGFVGLVGVIVLFTCLLFRILKVVDGLKDMRLKLIAAGIFGWVAIHVMLNIAAMIGIMPLTGITLPLLSYGGTSMMFIAGAIGLVFHLSKYTEHEKERNGKYEYSSSRRRVGRTRYASARGN